MSNRKQPPHLLCPFEIENAVLKERVARLSAEIEVAAAAAVASITTIERQQTELEELKRKYAN